LTQSPESFGNGPASARTPLRLCAHHSRQTCLRKNAYGGGRRSPRTDALRPSTSPFSFCWNDFVFLSSFEFFTRKKMTVAYSSVHADHVTALWALRARRVAGIHFVSADIPKRL